MCRFFEKFWQSSNTNSMRIRREGGGVISQSIFWCGFTSSRNGRRVELWHEKNEGHHVAAGVVQATDGTAVLWYCSGSSQQYSTGSAPRHEVVLVVHSRKTILREE